MPKKTKFQSQLERLQRRFYITESEFRQYYTDVRRANKKGSRLNKQVQGRLYVPKYTTTIAPLRTREDFEHYRQSVSEVLDVNYLNNINARMRSQFRENLTRIYGSAGGNELADKLNTLTDQELRQFFNENADFELMAYDSQTNIFEFIDLSVADIKGRITRFKQRKTKEKETKKKKKAK